MAKCEKPPEPGDVLQGTLDMLVLRALSLGPEHGHAIAKLIERGSERFLQIEQGSLYPALYRLERRGWLASSWAATGNNRRAKYYRLTPAGRKQLAEETGRWERMVRAITGVLNLGTE